MIVSNNKPSIDEMVKAGYINVQKHPELDLFIYVYSKSAEYEQVWNQTTIMARGLVMDDNNRIVARPFKKFFNMEQHSLDQIPDEPFEVFEKMDGSLGICFFYDNMWHIATKGSFTSDQANKANEMFKKYEHTFVPGNTYLFEIIYPENKIVLEYGDTEELVLLAGFENDTENEIPYSELTKIWNGPIVKKYDGVQDYKALKNMISDDQEGYVVRFKSGFRMKIKGEEYIRLHRIITNITSRTIWESLAANKSMDDILENVPDEFYDWVKYVESYLNEQFFRFKYNCITYLNMFLAEEGGSEIDKKKLALWVLNSSFIKKKYHAVIFNMADERDYSNIIWQRIKPEFIKPNQTFKDDFSTINAIL